MSAPAYLVHLLWALPVIALQLLVLGWRYGADAPRVLRRIMVPALAVTGWLVLADAVAIEAGIWRFAPAALVGLYVANVPIEEVVFFLLTNTLVALGAALVDGAGARRGDGTA